MRIVKTLFWSFFGVRKRSDLESDAERFKPHHIVIAGFVGVFFFVLGLIFFVQWVIL